MLYAGFSLFREKVFVDKSICLANRVQVLSNCFLWLLQKNGIEFHFINS